MEINHIIQSCIIIYSVRSEIQTSSVQVFIEKHTHFIFLFHYTHTLHNVLVMKVIMMIVVVYYCHIHIKQLFSLHSISIKTHDPLLSD